MKFNKDIYDKPWFGYTVAACTAVVLYLFLGNIKPFFRQLQGLFDLISPVFHGLIIAYILNPVVKLLEKKPFGRIRSTVFAHKLSVGITMIGFVVLVIVFFILLIPQLIQSVTQLVRNINSYSRAIQELLGELEEYAASKNVDISAITDASENLAERLISLVGSNLNTLISYSIDIGAAIFNAIISTILAVYFLADKDRLVKGINRMLRILLPEQRYQNTRDFWTRCNGILIRYVGCELLDALIVGVVNAVFMAITGMPYLILVSIAVGVTNLAPTFGPIVGAVIGAVILVLDNPWNALGFLAFTLILQTVDGYMIKPKLFGDTLGVPSVWILVTLVLGGRLFGIAGVLLSIPFAAIFAFVYHNFLYQREQKKRAELASKRQAASAAKQAGKPQR